MKYIKLIVVLIVSTLAGCSNDSTVSCYADADAVYLNLTKTFVLNEDGSIIQTVGKRQKLLTYRAFQSLYGDTRVSYNPAFQQLKINESVTTMADGTIVPTPENGYNEVLPRFAASSKVYNHLREMVVTHTGLERGATINCIYEIETKAGVKPFLMGNELLTTTCPIEDFQIVITVPVGTELNYKLLHSEEEPKVKNEKKSTTYTWNFEDLQQYNHEAHEPGFNTEVPRLVFSTQKSRDDVIDWFVGQEAFAGGIEELPKSVKKAVDSKKALIEKVLEIQRIVVDEMNYLPVPPEFTAFQFRTPKEVWESNSGTQIEKAALLTSLLKETGADAEVCVSFPATFEGEKFPFLLAAEPFVKVTLEGEESLLLSPIRINANNGEIEKFGYSSFSLETKMQLDWLKPEQGEISISGNIKLKEPGILSAELDAVFSDCYNPYLKLKGNEGAVKSLMPGLTGSIRELSHQQAIIHFKGEKSDFTQKRGDYYFVTLPESSRGVTSKHLLPLAMQRRSPLEFGNPLKEQYEYTLIVPDGLHMINKKIIKKVSSPVGQLSISIVQTGNEVKISKILEVTQSLISVQNYQAFKGLINEWNLKKYRQLVFRSPKES